MCAVVCLRSLSASLASAALAARRILRMKTKRIPRTIMRKSTITQLLPMRLPTMMRSLLTITRTSGRIRIKCKPLIGLKTSQLKRKHSPHHRSMQNQEKIHPLKAGLTTVPPKSSQNQGTKTLSLTSQSLNCLRKQQVSGTNHLFQRITHLGGRKLP